MMIHRQAVCINPASKRGYPPNANIPMIFGHFRQIEAVVAWCIAGRRHLGTVLEIRECLVRMIEKFAIAGRSMPSEFLDLNHTSKLMTLVSLLIPRFALEPSDEHGRTPESGLVQRIKS